VLFWTGDCGMNFSSCLERPFLGRSSSRRSTNSRDRCGCRRNSSRCSGSNSRTGRTFECRHYHHIDFHLATTRQRGWVVMFVDIDVVVIVIVIVDNRTTRIGQW
jgi:hypothetical protein